MRLPAVCNNCGAIFPSDYVVEGVSEAMYYEGNLEQCRKCGHMARIPVGLFNFANDAIDVLQAPDQTIVDLRRFGAILSDLRERGASVDEVQETIRTQAPQFASLADLLPQNRAELYTFLALLFAAIQALQSAASGVDIDIQDVNLNVDSVIEIIIEDREPPADP
jgi:hypothetical protein